MATVFLLVPYKVDKDGTFVVGKIRLYISYFGPTINVILSMIVLTRNLEFSTLKSDPYYLLGFLRILIYYLYVFISTIHLTSKALKLSELCNNLRDWESKIPLSVWNLQLVTWLSISQVLYSLTVGILHTTLSVYGNSDNRRIVHIGKVLDGVIRLLPEINQFIFLDTILTFSFFISVIHDNLEKMMRHPKDGFTFFRNRVKPFEKERNLLTWENLNEMRLYYGKVHGAKEDINKVYSVHNILTLGYVLIELVFIIFLNITISNLWVPYGEKLPTIKFHQIRLIFISNAVKMYVVAYICEMISRKMKKTGVLVHRLFYETKDSVIKSEVI